MKKGFIVCSCVLFSLCSISFAQDQQSSPKTPVAAKRQVNQQKRIAAGVKSGQLTPSETRRVERQQVKIQKDKQTAKSDGKVTPKERVKLQHEQNRASRKIDRLKHNDKTTEPAK